jgi:glucokinase
MDIPRGLILEPSNLPGWRNFPVRDCLAGLLGLPVTYSNDANAAAYGEYWCGAGRDARSMVFFTLGTGVGGGIIVGDLAIEGAHSVGAELGHVVVDTSPQARRCSCGQSGHLEAYASATALVDRFQERLTRQTPAGSAGAREPVSARWIAEAAACGDPLARDLVLETADWLARGIALTGHVIDPELFMLGGAMDFGGAGTPLGEEFLGRVRQKAAGLVFPEIARTLKIGFATLGAESGWIGAAGLACRDWLHPQPAPKA